MAFAGINHIAVLIAAVAGFAFGAVYYIGLSRQWLAAVGKNREEVAARRSPVPFIVSIVALLIMAWVLAGGIGHLGPGQVTLKNGIISALFMWLGFVITTLAVNYSFAQRRSMLTVIDGIHWLGVLVIQGAIIGAMGV
jgi:hypothetical protein